MFKLGDFIKTEDGIRAKVIESRRGWNCNHITLATDSKKVIKTEDTKLKNATVLKRTKTLDRIFKSFADIEAIRIKDKYIDGVSIVHGSDPEIFVVDGKTNEVIPAFNFLKGKDSPNEIQPFKASEGEGEALFWDGFQAEFNAHASTCFGWVQDGIHNGLMTLNKLAKEYNKDAKLVINPTLDIPIDMLMESKEEHVQFGCMPSFNAYGMEGLKLSGRDVPFRSAGGHIHFGLSPFYGERKLTKVQAEKYVKSLDKILGVMCVSLFAKYDDPKRRELYGLAGEYRIPKHGLEYRTLSNVWMCHPLIFNIVFELARKIVVLEHFNLLSTWKTTDAETIECINKCDVKLAQKIMKRNRKLIDAIFYSISPKEKDTIFEIFMRGVDSIIDNPNDVVNNWDKNYASHGDGLGHQIRSMDYLQKYRSLVKAISEKTKAKTA